MPYYVKGYLIMTRFAVVIALFVLLASCQKAESTQPEVVVDPAFEAFFERFEAEGEARGMEVDLRSEAIGAIFSSQLAAGQAGLCTQYTSGVAIIEIKPSAWSGASDLQREHLIFHELGHCYLGRSHYDEADARGFCVSIMQSGEGACRYHYRNDTRAEYLDELFGDN